MTREEARIWILNNCFTKKGDKLSPCYCRVEYLAAKNKDVYEILLKKTNPIYCDSISKMIQLFLDDKYQCECISCGKILKKLNLFCDAKCQNKSGLYENFKNSHSPEANRKRKKTNIEKFGNEYAVASETVKKKIKTVCREKYNADSYFGSDEGQQKINETQIKLYGAVGLKSKFILNKTQEKQKVLYGGVGLKSNSILLKAHKEKNKLNPFGVIDKNSLRESVKENGVYRLSLINNCDDSTIYKAIHRCGLNKELLRKQSSIFEDEVYNFVLKNSAYKVIKNDRNVIKPYEMDILIPEYNIGFECNGLFWHSEKYKDNNYHYIKSEQSRANGIKLIHIWEDDWNYSKDIIKHKILHHLNKNDKVYARKTIPGFVGKIEAKDFLIKYHIQGNGNSSIATGLYYDDVLISLMTFKRHKNNEYTLDRFCSSCDVIGGFSKLLKYTINEYKIGVIHTFHDISYNGMGNNVYNKSGFEFDYLIKPDYKYLYNNKRIHKFNFRHKNLKRILNNYNENESEHTNCYNHKIYKVYDAGKQKYKMIIKENLNA